MVCSLASSVSEDAGKLKFRKQVRPFSLIGGSLGHTCSPLFLFDEELRESGSWIALGRKAFSLLATCLKEEQKADGDERWMGAAPMSSQSLLFPGGGVGLPSG